MNNLKIVKTNRYMSCNQLLNIILCYIALFKYKNIYMQSQIHLLTIQTFCARLKERPFLSNTHQVVGKE